MSVRALSGEYTGIPDDLESFFYVILWHAVRFLRHNCSDVDSFMANFFDGVEFYNGYFHCGSAKLATMRDGVIRLCTNALNTGLLEFRIHDSDEAHPLNDLFDDILELFKAYYVIHTKVPSRSRARRIHNVRQVGTTDSSHPNRGQVTSEISYVHATEPTSAYSTASSVPAHQLSDHDAMSGIFKDALNQEWPEEDKVEDQLSAGYDHDKAQKYQTKINAKPEKTDASVEQEDNAEPSRKRQKTTTDVVELVPQSSNGSATPSRAIPIPARKIGGRRTPPKKPRSRKTKKT